MKDLAELFVGLLGLLLIVAYFSLAVGALGLSVYGLYLAFSASTILGILALIGEPLPLLFGVVMFFFDKDLPRMIVERMSQ